MDPFVIKWLLSLVVGASWVAIATTIAEKIGGKIGGLILGLPSTAFVSLLFIGLTQGMGAEKIAAVALLFSSGPYCFYYIAYLLLAKKGFKIAFFGSLLLWFCLALFSNHFYTHELWLALISSTVLISASIFWTVKNVPIDLKRIPKKIIKTPLWLKAAISGGVISTIVLIGKLAGPAWGGVLGTFPAMVVSTLLITSKSGGIEFTRLIMKNVLISTTTTIGLLGFFSYLLIPRFGILFGMTLAYLALMAISLPLYFGVFEKIKD